MSVHETDQLLFASIWPVSKSTPITSPTTTLVDDRVRVLRPVKRRIFLIDLWRSRSATRILSARDYKVKYKQSLLGPAWLVIQPLGLLAGFIVAFKGLGHVSSGGVPYALFTLCGLTAWSFFQAAINMGAAAIISNSQLLRFTPCPRVSPLLSALISTLPAFAVTAVGSLVWAAAAGDLSPRALLLPFGLVWLLLLTFGAISFTAAVSSRYRDMITALPFIIQVGTFLAPIGYSLQHLSGAMRVIVECNPITGVTEVFRWMIVAGYHPSVLAIVLSISMTLVLFVVGWFTFTSLEPTFSDVI